MVAGAVIMRTSTQSSTSMAPTDNLFWVSLWSVDDEGWWTLSKPSQGRKEGRKEVRKEGKKVGRKDGREEGRKIGRKEDRKGG